MQPLQRIEAKCAPPAGGWRYLRVCWDNAAAAGSSERLMCCEIQQNDQNCTRPARKFNLALVNNQQHEPGAKLVLILYTRRPGMGCTRARTATATAGNLLFCTLCGKVAQTAARRALWKHSHFVRRAPGAT